MKDREKKEDIAPRGADGLRPPDEVDLVGTVEAEVESPTPAVTRAIFSRGGVLAAFGHRDFTLLWSGAFVSNLGTLIQNTVLMWYVKELTNTNRWVAAVNFANFAPIIILVLWAGSLADRVDRRRLIIWSQVVMMLAALTLGITTSFGVSYLWVIMVLTLVIGIAFALNFPAWRALVPDIVSPEDLLNAVALDAAGFNMARFLGPALGGLILALWHQNPEGAFYLNAVSFLAVIAALSFIKARPKLKPVTVNVRQHIREGLSYLRHEAWAMKLLAMLGFSTFFGLSYVVLLPAFARDVMHQGSWVYVLLLGGSGLGASISAPITTRLSRNFEERQLIRSGLLGFAISLLVLAGSKWIALSFIASVSIGVNFLMASASVVTVLQSRVEREMRGRIMSFYILVFQGSAPIGGLLLGILADHVGAPAAMFVGAGAVTALSVASFIFPSMLRDVYAGGRELSTRA